MKRTTRIRQLPPAAAAKNDDVFPVSQLTPDGTPITVAMTREQLLKDLISAVSEARAQLVSDAEARDMQLQEQISVVQQLIDSNEAMDTQLQASLVMLQQSIVDSSNKTPFDMWLEQPGNAGKSLQDYYDSFKGSPGTTTWAGITNKPVTFPPSEHQHSMIDVQGLTESLADKSSLSHIHNIGDVMGLNDALNERLTSVSWSQIQEKPSAYTPTAHKHSMDEITGLQSALDAKLSSVSWGQVSGKPSTFAPSTHSHSINEVTGLQAALDAKGNTLIGTATISETLLLALSAGVRSVNLSVPGVVPGGNYVLFRTATGTANVGILDTACFTAGTLEVRLQVPALAIGASYSIPVRIVRLNT